MKMIKTRLLSFGLIASLGFILLVSLSATAVVEGLGSRLKAMMPDVTVVLFYIINLLLTLVVTTFLFGIIFKVLPDAKIRWKAVLPGAFATSILFMIGKFGISLYVSNSDLGTSYGAAGSLAVIFVWIYYSAIILYFGAEFTKVYALNKGEKIVPNQYAQWDESPTVPGASSEKSPAKQYSPDPSENEKRPTAKQPVPQLAIASSERVDHQVPVVRDVNRSEENGEGPGMGSVLLGLALYFMTRGKDSERKR
jgi:membrane protein